MADAAIDRADELGRRNIAAPWWNAGFSVVPISADGTKSPLVQWKRGRVNYQETPADLSTVKYWFEERWPRAGVAIICGRVSGNVELLELEGRANTEETISRIETACVDAGIGDLWHQLTNLGYTELSPSGGLHIIYRVIDEPVPSNTKIATRPALDHELNDQERERRQIDPDCSVIRVLAETRGEGGYVVVAPTGGHAHRSGNPWTRLTGSPANLVQVRWGERNTLHEVIKTLLHVPDPREQQLVPVTSQPAVIAERDPDQPPTPVEDFNERSSWNDSWFMEQGWRVHHQDGQEIFWVRPGKDWGDGHSATTGVRVGGQDCLYVWSTSTGLPVEVPLTKFMVYAHYKFNGDRSAAARQLRKQGYGAPLHPPLTPLRDEDLQIRDPDAAPTRELRPHDLENLLQDFTGGEAVTDSGYAARIKERYQDRIRYVPSFNSWYIWHAGSGVWSEDRYSFVPSAVKEEAVRTYNWVLGMQRANPALDRELRLLAKHTQSGLNHGRMKAVTETLREDASLAAHHDDFDVNLDLLNLQNGTLNLNTLELLPHESSNLITMSFNAAYDPDADCPNFVKYLTDVFPDEGIRSYIQRAIGYSLLGRPSERAIFILHGPSGTGKSVFTGVITELFGTYGTTAPSSTFKQKHQDSTFDLHDLRGKRFVSGSELPQRLEMNEELVKRMTGDGDRVKSRGLYQGFVEWHPRCVIWLATNHLPKLSSDDDAMWRRVRTVPMRTVIKDQKEEIGGFSTILIQEADGLLNWALEGLQEYRRIGLAEPSAILQDIETYRNESDTVSSWLNYTLLDGIYQLDPDVRILAAQAFNDYEQFCRDNGQTPFGKPRFTKRIESMGTLIEHRRVGGRSWLYGICPNRGITP